MEEDLSQDDPPWWKCEWIMTRWL